MRLTIVLCLVLATSARAESPLVRVQSYHLNQAQIQEYSIKAMEGSGDAAIRLCDNYFFDRYDAKGNRTVKGALRWAIIGAENGNTEAQFRSYQLLSVSGDKLDQVRALFWLKRAASGHYLGANEILNSCPSVSSTRLNGQPCFGPGSDK